MRTRRHSKCTNRTPAGGSVKESATSTPFGGTSRRLSALGARIFSRCTARFTGAVWASASAGIRGSVVAILFLVSQAVEESNRRLLRARDAMDRAYAEPLDIPALARIACVSEAHFSRTFLAAFGETPHRYLQRRRV